MRVRDVADLGVRTRDFAYRVHGLEPPASPFGVELRAPDGSTWGCGPEDAGDRVAGGAVDFCLVVTQRRPLRDADLGAEGADAHPWLEIVQAVAGPPGEKGPHRRGKRQRAGHMTDAPSDRQLLRVLRRPALRACARCSKGDHSTSSPGTTSPS